MSILQDLNVFYDRLDRRGLVPPQGYLPRPVGFALMLRADGTVDETIDLRVPDKDKLKLKNLIIPRLRDHNNKAAADPFLFCDNTGYALGVVKKEMKRGSPIEAFENFKSLHKRWLSNTRDEGCIALLRFLEQWNPDCFKQLRIDPELKDRNLVFCLSGDTNENGNPRFLHDRTEAKEIWRRYIEEQPSEKPAQCLVTGNRCPPARLHPSFRLPPISPQDKQHDAPIVSFNEAAFKSFEKEKGQNAPVSEETTFRYGTALNWLLSPNARRSLLVGNTTVVFWAEDRGTDEESAECAENTLEIVFSNREFDPDRADAGRIRAAVQTVAKGTAKEIDPKLNERTIVHLLGLSPNNARVAVRFYVIDSFGDLAKRLHQHMLDLQIKPNPFDDLFPNVKHLLIQLAPSTVNKNKWKHVPPRLGGELMEAILTGKSYPRTLLTTVIERIRADKVLNGPRAALIKAWLTRDMRLTRQNSKIPQEDDLMALRRENNNPGYLLGRLFATYTYAESSVAKRNATLRDKYIGSASATPQRIFPTLMRGYEHNRSNLLKGEHPGAAIRCDQEAAEILDKLSDEFPRMLPPEDQGRFFIGFYHQERFFYTKAEPKPKDQPAETEGA